MLTTSQIKTQFGDLSGNNATSNQTRGLTLYNQSSKLYITKYYLNEVLYTTTTTAGTLIYNLPYDIKELVTVYIVVGNLRYTLTEAPTAQFWDNLQFAQYSSDIPQYFWVFNKQVHIFPTPSSTGNTIGIRYKKRLKDLSLADYTTGTVSATNASTTITGSGTTFYPAMAGQWIQFIESTSATTSGDEGWYQINTYTSATQIDLINPYTGTTASGMSFTIGEVSLIPEDYQWLPLWRSLKIYYTSIKPDKAQAALYKDLTDQEEAKLDAEFGNKTTNVRITSADAEMTNPNLYIRTLG